jgi:hypothetical protein
LTTSAKPQIWQLIFHSPVENYTGFEGLKTQVTETEEDPAAAFKLRHIWLGIYAGQVETMGFRHNDIYIVDRNIGLLAYFVH